ncbi:hypothetical protein P3342_008431 [Pyrenophora teres f. teres]|uniref:Uncharacterized protein n=1 Tax=Pyrenophora teres f. teres TaxID=97479 RepID=A0A6S6WCE9_9PLEO|nr:hypothetical protein HRS9139_07187 [Pyrenophora teres f. teres]KAE8829608.1 hypothetical protein HRS9122_09423 [Pyrenophora teres f. teres]KAE8830566.1 hypothetical protein PTNB85_07153 [Pyrenophora teres f. teres]KAE8857433.1 hypothetical protein PTNB29_08500 [Pyrenophora teres f. teres]KAE8863217.1 hypothetical protein PTNB73_06424 [Pyrenophora teres f. teres]
MRLIAIIATLTTVVFAISIPLELQERQCLNNGQQCDILNNKCCSGYCHAILCGGNVYNCETPQTACIPGKKSQGGK